MPTFYRVEDDAQDGPYKSYSGCYSLDGTHIASVHNDDAHPAPWEDGLVQPSWGSAWRCAFVGLDELVEWFAGWADDLERCGYHVAGYDIPMERARIGAKQVLIHREPGDRPVYTAPMWEVFGERMAC